MFGLLSAKRKSIILTVWGRGGLVGEPKWCFPRRCARLRASSRCARLRRRVRAALGPRLTDGESPAIDLRCEDETTPSMSEDRRERAFVVLVYAITGQGSRSL